MNQSVCAILYFNVCVTRPYRIIYQIRYYKKALLYVWPFWTIWGVINKRCHNFSDILTPPSLPPPCQHLKANKMDVNFSLGIKIMSRCIFSIQILKFLFFSPIAVFRQTSIFVYPLPNSITPFMNDPWWYVVLFSRYILFISKAHNFLCSFSGGLLMPVLPAYFT